MTTIVLVHGAWHGGWCWQRVADLLERKGHSVSAPTLAGLAERADLLSRQIDLSSHIDDIVGDVVKTGAADVMLVAHSYGGFPATAAAQRLSGIVSHLVLIDAFLPADGEKLLDHAPGLIDVYRAQAEADESWHIPPLPSAIFGVEEADRVWVDKRLTAQPVNTYFESVSLGEPLEIPHKTYIRCTQAPADVLERSLSRAGTETGWRRIDLDAPHDAMITHPQALADMLNVLCIA